MLKRKFRVIMTKPLTLISLSHSQPQLRSCVMRPSILKARVAPDHRFGLVVRLRHDLAITGPVLLGNRHKARPQRMG